MGKKAGGYFFKTNLSLKFRNEKKQDYKSRRVEYLKDFGRLATNKAMWGIMELRRGRIIC